MSLPTMLERMNLEESVVTFMPNGENLTEGGELPSCWS